MVDCLFCNNHVRLSDENGVVIAYLCVSLLGVLPVRPNSTKSRQQIPTLDGNRKSRKKDDGTESTLQPSLGSLMDPLSLCGDRGGDASVRVADEDHFSAFIKVRASRL
jgi:hypothetical protein